MPGHIDDIKARLDLVELIQSYIRLNKSGVNWKATCPFHSEKTPSFVVSPARQIWHCFGCGKGGSHIDFVMEIEGLEFRDALELLAKRAGIQLRREDPKLRSERTRLYQLVEDAAKIFEFVLHASKTPERISAPLAYLKQRGLADETIQTWRIGYAPISWDYLMRALRERGYREAEIEKAGLAVKSEQGSYYDRFRNRITFPVADASGRVVGFSGRIFDQIGEIAKSASGPGKNVTENNLTKRSDSPSSPSSPAAKYINTPQTLIYDKSRVLYGFDKARDDIRKNNSVVLVEGQMDVVLSHQAGIRNTVAVSGTALASQQLQTLKRLASTIVSSFDRDQAGERATKRSLDLAAAFGFERKVAILPPGAKDPAEAVSSDPAIWQQAVREAKPIVQFFLETGLAKHDRTTAAGKRAIAEAVLPEINILSSEVEKSHWIQALAKEIAVAEEALWREMSKTGSAPSAPLSYKAAAPIETQPAGRRAQLESLLVGALLLHPEAYETIATLPRETFLNETHLQILEIVGRALTENPPAGGREHTALLAVIPEEFREICNRLAFQAEVVLERIENKTERAREILVCVRELEREWAREKLRELTTEISRAESGGNRAEVEKFLVEFRTLSQKVQ
ncbi:MAG: CHC2 zinc finger domain-containing protein [Patescibacteria group bacterium]